MIRYLLLCYIILTVACQSSFGQLEIKQQPKKKSGWKQEKMPTQVAMEFTRNQSFRTLVPNAAFLNTPLGERANETPSTLWSYGLGIQSGLLWLQQGEQYAFNDPNSDSSLNYSNRYRYLGLPLALNVQYGSSFRVFVGAGIAPMIFNRSIQQINWSTAVGANEKETLKVKNNDFSSAVFQVYFQGGMQYTGEKGLGIILKAVYRQQLSNTYGKYNAYIHKANAMGFTLGISKTF
jgi:hypothetical protein